MEEITNAVIVERIENLKEYFGDALDRIESQTTKTNGRVTTLETATTNLKSNYSFLKGGLAVLSFGIPVVLTIMFFILSSKP